MADQELTRILADLVRTNAGRQLPNMQQVSGLSQALLSNVGVQNPYKSAESQFKDPRGPSFVNRVLDVMSRPLYGVMNYAKGSAERGAQADSVPDAIKAAFSPDAADDIWQGLSGKEKTTGKDVLHATGADEHMDGFDKFVVGTTLDVLGDPLTYVGGLGLASKLGKAAKVSTAALRGVEEGTAKTAQSLTQEIAARAARQANDLKTPAEELATALPKQADNILPNALENIPKTVENMIPNQPPGWVSRFGPTGRRSSPIGKPGKADFVPKLGTQGDYKAPFGSFVRDLPSKAPDFSDDLLEAGAEKFATKVPGFARDVEGHLDEGVTAGGWGRTSEEVVKAAKLAEEVAPTAKSAAKAVEEAVPVAKTSVAKQILAKDAEKLNAGVKPADVLSQAAKAPAEFPNLTINERWINAARKAAQSFLKSNRMQNINHVGQTNLYNKVLHAAGKVAKNKRGAHVLQMLRVAEEEVLASGRKLTDSEGLSIRLSDVANMTGGSRSLTPRLVDDFRKARPSQAVEDVRAFNAPKIASQVLDPVIQTAKEMAPQVQKLAPSQIPGVTSDISKALTNIARKAGASAHEAGTAKKFIDELFNLDRDKLYGAVEKEARDLVRQSYTGRVNPRALSNVTEATYKSLGANPKVLGRDLNQQKVVEGIMTKFATWWGAKDLKPFSREYIDTARNVAAAFSETLKPLVRATTRTQRRVAWNVARGKQASASPAEEALAGQFKYLIERLMGTHGITNNAEAVVLRSGTLLKELNEELPKTLQLIDSKGTDKLGRAFDYTKDGWMHSWKEWDVEDPAETLYQLTRSLQMVTRRNAMWDDAAARWGMPVRGAEFQHAAHEVGRLKGTYFPEQIATQLNNLQRQMARDVFRAPHKSIELFDKVQRMWKTGVTIYSPSHHIRNLNGDVYLAALDGVVSPKPYAIATKVMHAFPTRYKSLESVFNIMDPNLRERALRARPGNVVLTTKAGEKMTAEQVYQAAESQGLFNRAAHAEDLATEGASAFGTFGTKFQPFKGRVNDAATAAAELRDHWVRLAHFTDVLTKSRSPLRVAIEEAGRRVRKFHPDGMDLTGMEQNVLRRVIPFYSWMRKATPLVIEGALMRPHISTAFPKAMANIQYATGIESQGPGDPFPMDQMFPDWLREKGIGPVLGPGSGIGRDETWRGEAPGYTIINPTNPFTDSLAQLGSPGKSVLSSLSPGLRIPIELMTGQTSLGIPLESSEGGVPGYLAQQVPAIGIGARLTGATRDNEPWNPEQLINFLTSAGVTGTGPYKPQAQMELRDLLAKMAKDNRGDYR